MTWKPIKTAPKEKGKMLLGFKGGRIFIMQWGRFLEGTKERNQWADEAHEFPVTATHWMALPPLPSNG